MAQLVPLLAVGSNIQRIATSLCMHRDAVAHVLQLAQEMHMPLSCTDRMATRQNCSYPWL